MSGIDVFAQLALRMKYPKSERMRAIFEKMVTLEEGELLLELPAAAEEIARKLNIDKGVIDSKIEELHRRGLVVSSSKGYVMPRNVFQLHDTVLASPDVTDDLADLWQAFSEEEWFVDQARELAEAGSRRTKVVPAWKAVQTSRSILPGEDVRQIIDQARIVVFSQCPCRRRGRLCDGPLNICLQLDKAAEYVIKRGTGRQVSKEEAIEALGNAEEQGLIHTGLSSTAMCTCCSCCCILLRPLIKHGKLAQGLVKSSYRSVVNPELCAGCQLCIEDCRFDAIEMRKYPGSKKFKASVDAEKCFGCGVCVVRCPSKGALRLELSDVVSNA